MEVVIITGLSGAGKSKAANWFEDKGYYVIDNMPPALIKNFIDLSLTGGKNLQRAAFVLDIRGGRFFDDLKTDLSVLEGDANVELKVLYMEASNEALIRRYKETRRAHPINNGPATAEAIDEERRILSELRAHSNYVIDTSNIKISECYQQLDKLFLKSEEQDSFMINIVSFGYKKGVPQEADWTIDCRFIPNPFYVPTLKKLTGNNKKVSQYVLKQEVSQTFLLRLVEMISRIIPSYIQEGKYSLTIAFGCTGGQHRSVAMANEVARIFKEEGRSVTLSHRELKK